MTAVPPPEVGEPNSGKPEQLYSITELAELFHVHRRTVWNWVTTKKLAAFKLGGRWRIKHSEVMRFANQEYGEKP